MAESIYYADLKSEKLCCLCTHARMRKDVCGIYCKVGRVENGQCDRYVEYGRRRKDGQRNSRRD